MNSSRLMHSQSIRFKYALRIAIPFGLLLVLSTYALIKASDELGTWKATAWAISYQHFGFVKRGLIGSLVPTKWLTYDGIQSLSIAVLIILSMLTLWIGSSSYRMLSKGVESNETTRTAFLWAIFTIVAPFTLVQFTYDVGRFDQILFLFSLGSLLLLLKYPNTYTHILNGAVLTLLPFIHEAAVLLVIPIYFVTWGALAIKWQRPLYLHIATIFSVTSAFIASISYGKFNGDQALIIQQLVDSNLGFKLESGSLAVINNTLEQNIQMTLAELPRRSIQILGFLVFMLPIWKLLKLLHAQVTEVLSHAWVIPFSALSILPLFFLGFDFFRWFAAAVFNLFIIESILVIHFKRSKSFITSLHKERKWLYISLFASVWMGPAGITSYFPAPFMLIVGN